MHFELSEERQMLQDTLRRYLARAHDRDLEALWGELAQLGVIGALVGADHGGYGGAGWDLAVVFEELGRAGVRVPLLQNGVLCAGLLAEHDAGSWADEIAAIIEGRQQWAFAHTEPQSRYHLACVDTTATASAGTYVLHGHKSVVSNGAHAQRLIVSARVAGERDAQQGISLFVLDADHPGVQLRSFETADGEQAAELSLLGCQLPSDALLGTLGEAYEAIERQAARACTALCAEATGAMQAVVDLSLDYLRTRKQFGVAIGSFQALQHRMADVLIELEQARSATINSAAAQTLPRLQREMHVSAAKNLIGRAGRLVAEESIQLHGGIGMTEEYALGRLAKRLIMIDHQWGDSDYHLQRYIELGKA